MNLLLKFKIFKNLYRLRSVELEISRRYKNGKMRCPTHLSVGQEAVSAVISEIFQDKDFAISTHRGHTHYLSKGGSLKKMLAEIYGKKNGCSKGKGGSMHLIDLKKNFMGTSPIVGNSIPIGVGLGLSLKIKKINGISFIFLGDGATEEGVFYESLNFSIIKKLPVIFICENNLYSVYSSLNVRQPKNRKIFKMCKSIGIESYFCEGNKLEKIFKVLKKCSKKVKKYGKPIFIEFSTYRWLEHCGPNYDNKIGYRSENEFNSWKKKDPLLNLEFELIKKNKKKILNIKKLIDKEIKLAFNFAENSKFPEKKDAYKGVYAKKN